MLRCARSFCYLRGNGREAAAEVQVLVDLTAIGCQEPVPERLVSTHRRLVAEVLIRQKARQVPVVRWRGPNQCNEDGFRGHIELKEQTHKTISMLETQCIHLHALKDPILAFVFMSYRNETHQRHKGEKH